MKALPGCKNCKAGERSGQAAREPLRNSLHAQRGLKRAAVVSCLDGQGGSLSERQGAADARFRPRPSGLSGWPALVVDLFRWIDIHLQKGAWIANQPERLSMQGVF